MHYQCTACGSTETRRYSVGRQEPQRPSVRWPAWLLAAILLGGSAVVLLYAGFGGAARAAGNAGGMRLLAVSALVASLATFGGMVAVLVADVKRAAAWRLDLMRWSQAWQCQRCGAFLNPPQQAVSAARPPAAV
jgi:hypothetical protein